MAIAFAARVLSAAASGQSVARLAFQIVQPDLRHVRSDQRLMRRFWLGKDQPSVSKIFAAESDLERYLCAAGQVAGAAEAVGGVRSSRFVFSGHS